MTTVFTNTTESEEDVERRIKEENDAYIKKWREELAKFLATTTDFYSADVQEVLLRKLANDEDIYCDDLY